MDISGHTYNGIKVISYSHFKVRHYWNCVCICGREIKVRANSLRTGHVKSCGCTKSEILVKEKTTHGWCYTPEYQIWGHMISRCKATKGRDYKAYTSKGIKVCERWRLFENFIADMGKRPTNKHSIDRINSNGDYEPSNCRWATQQEQIINRSCTLYIIHNGNNIPFSVFCKEHNLVYNRSVLWLKAGFSSNEIIAKHKAIKYQPYSNSKLSKIQIIAIREAISSGHSLANIGRYFKTTLGTIWKIKSGYSWRSV